MNKKFLHIVQILISFALIVFLSFCHNFISEKKNLEFQSPYINYDKVKIWILSDQNQYQFKGYIYSIKDTSICFRFWGPFGYEIGRGLIMDNFTFFNATTNQTITNLKEQMENNIGISLNKSVLFYLIAGNISDLSNELLKLNKNLVTINAKGNEEISINHSVSLKKITINFYYSKGILSDIKIVKKGLNSIFELKLEIIERSHEKKTCRFSL